MDRFLKVKNEFDKASLKCVNAIIDLAESFKAFDKALEPFIERYEMEMNHIDLIIDAAINDGRKN